MALELKLAEKEDVRLKAYIYGAPGTGKTVTSLHFPTPFVIDTEGGTDHYAGMFKFYRKRTGDPLVVNSILSSLLDDPQGVKTVIIDSFSVLYDNIQSAHQTRMKLKTGKMDYVLQPLDYKVIKAEVKSISSKLMALDMNVIVTARATTLYSKDVFMQVDGLKPEGPPALEHVFDIVLRLEKAKSGTNEKFTAFVEKDRTNSLPPSFEFSYESFVKYIGIEGLEREPVVFKQKQQFEMNSQRNLTVKFDGKEIKTAGITAENLKKLQKLSETLGPEAIQQMLREEYAINSSLDLKNDEAELLIKTLTSMKEK